MPSDALIDRPGIELQIKGSDAVSASELAAILRTMDVAFRQFSGRGGLRQKQLSLAVRGVERGSVNILIEAIDGAQKLWDGKEIWVPFTNHLMDAARILLGLQAGRVTAAEKKTIAAISQPIASGHATQINLVNQGVIHLHVDQETASALLHATEPPRQEPPINLISEAPFTMLTQSAIRDIGDKGVNGTALVVDTNWYARLEGGSGVLVPLSENDWMKLSLQHGRSYLFRGAVLRGVHGEPVGIQVSAAIPLDDSSSALLLS